MSTQPLIPLKSDQADDALGTRDVLGRFDRVAPDSEMLDGVAEIALIATEGDLEAAALLSTRRWSSAQEKLKDERCPKTATGVMRRLDASWERCLELALADPASRVRLRAGWAPGEGLEHPDEVLLDAIASVAHELGRTPTFAEFDTRVVELEASYERMYGHELRLPNVSTVITRFGTWRVACERAGLAPIEPFVVEQLDPADLVNLCIDEIGVVPASRWFEAWCRTRGYRLGRQRWADTIDTARERREATGNAWPEQAPSSLPPAAPLPTDRQGERTRYAWSDEAILEALGIYLADVDKRKRTPSLRDYMAFSRGRLDMPGKTTLEARKVGLHKWFALTRNTPKERPS